MPVGLRLFLAGGECECAVVDDALSPDFPLGDALEVFVRREDAEALRRGGARRRSRDAAKLRIEERELEADGLN